MALDENIETFVMHTSSLGSKMSIHPARKAQLALLLTKKVYVSIKYPDFADVFSEKLANVLPKHTGANKCAIKLEKNKQPTYKPIYSLGPVELETLKIYIETNLTNNLIQANKVISRCSDFVCLQARW